MASDSVEPLKIGIVPRISTPVIRTEQIYLPPDLKFSQFCHYANNLYNEANYLVRQSFFRTGEWIRYPTLNWLIKDVVQSRNYTKLPAQTSQQLLRLLDTNWKAFFRAIKDWKTHPAKYHGRPRPPKYRPKNGEALLLFTNQQVKIKDNFLILPKKLGKIKTRLTKKLRGARLLPQSAGYLLEILYEKEEIALFPKNNRIGAIDLGINNLITMVNNIGKQPIVINGKSIKAMNQLFNKRKSVLQSISAKQGVKISKKMNKLMFDRKKQMKNVMHKASRFTIAYCLENDIDTLVVGYNKTWKQQINLGKVNNQKFVSIPFLTLVNQLKYKCEDSGIHFHLVDEQYTSKCSFLDNERIEKHAQYKGRRVNRGLFKTAQLILINADVNAAYNIMRKVFPKAFAEGIAGVGLHPKRIKLFV